MHRSSVTTPIIFQFLLLLFVTNMFNTLLSLNIHKWQDVTIITWQIIVMWWYWGCSRNFVTTFACIGRIIQLGGNTTFFIFVKLKTWHSWLENNISNDFKIKEMANLCTPSGLCEKFPNMFLIIIEGDHLLHWATTMKWGCRIVCWCQDDIKYDRVSCKYHEVMLLHQQPWKRYKCNSHRCRDYI
jgi:hypothetical protein